MNKGKCILEKKSIDVINDDVTFWKKKKGGEAKMEHFNHFVVFEIQNLKKSSIA